MLGGQSPTMAKVADHLVGRAAELEAIDRALGELCDGRPAPLVIQGEPGIGKTRLLAELAERADARGCTVLAGSASELERDLPFWVFVDALDEYVAGLDPQLVASLRDEVRSELAHVLPSLSDLASGGPARPAGRALPRPSRGARAARAARGAPAARAGARRRPLGGRRVGGAARARCCAARPTPPSSS